MNTTALLLFGLAGGLPTGKEQVRAIQLDFGGDAPAQPVEDPLSAVAIQLQAAGDCCRPAKGADQFGVGVFVVHG